MQVIVLPVPGSPVKAIKKPLGMPPDIILSSSGIPVESLSIFTIYPFKRTIWNNPGIPKYCPKNSPKKKETKALSITKPEFNR